MPNLNELIKANSNKFKSLKSFDRKAVEEYVHLLSDEVPKKGENLLLLSIKDAQTIFDLLSILEYKNIVIIDNDTVIKKLKAYIKILGRSNKNLICYVASEVNINLSMQFDLIIANPPYGKFANSIISETITHLTDKGIASVLMPIRWLLDPLALQKKNSDWLKYSNIRDCIEDLYFISRECSEKLFDIQLDTQLAVYKISEKGGYDFSKIREDDRIRDLAINYKDKIKDSVQVINDMQLIFIDILEVYGGNVVRGNWIKPFGYKKPLASTAKGNSVRKGIIFNTIAEAKNFYEYSNSKLFKYWNITLKSGYHFHFGKYFPDLRNVHWTDPVTGIQYDGYKVKWTDEALYRYFGITTDEISKIEEKVDQYSKAYKS